MQFDTSGFNNIFKIIDMISDGVINISRFFDMLFKDLPPIYFTSMVFLIVGLLIFAIVRAITF